ncbi:hypothetical protein [Streptomyces sp. NPDC101249]|uniref:hypothetical protein n=1 Tax=Streptomyces sp. NPDC101249 TaxID=3366140 RepID=UPI0038004EDC
MRSQRSVMTAPRDAMRRIVGCAGCAGHQRPGYVREWEEDASSPHGMSAVWKRCPQGCTAESRQASVDRQLAARLGRPVGGASAPAASAGTSESTPAAVVPAPVVTSPPARKSSTSRRPAAPRAVRAARPELLAAVAVDADDAGRLVLDVAGGSLESPTVDGLFAWLGTVPAIGVARVHEDAPDRDGTVCLSAAACAALKIPAKLPTGKRADQVAAKLRKAADAHGIELSETIGAGFKAWRRKGEAGPRLSVKVIVTPWLGQGETGAVKAGELITQLAGPDADARTLARRLRRFSSELGIAPGATSAVSSWQLLDAVRPRVRWAKDDAGRWSREAREGALPDGDTAVPVAAGARHPLTRERTAARLPVCEEEDFKWWAREVTEEEAARPWAVALDVCASYLSVPETLRLPSGPLVHTDSPVFDGKAAGLWLCDLTGLATEAELPHPATFTGLAPEGPGWYATPTVDYMAREYGFDVATIGEAYVSTHTAPILREWLAAIRTAYKGAMATLGLVDGMDDAAFLTAWSSRKDTAADPAREDAAVLVDAYKALYKGGVGKWADSARHLADDEWADRVAAAWHYRPEIRHHVIAAARIAAHRRMRKTLRLTGRAPLAVNVDQVLYAADAPHPAELLPKDDAGRPVPGTLRLGSAPGSFKHESSVPMAAVVAALADREHPSRLTHDYTPAGTPVTDTEV